MGQAILDYFRGKKDAELIVGSTVEEKGPMEAAHFFRTEENLPPLEKTALENCRGKVLDVGAGAGCHSLILQERNFDVISIDTSPHSFEVLKERGIKNPRLQNFHDIEDEQYDTILILMNGFGIAGTIEGLKKMLLKAKSLLNPAGQIIADSADILYAYEGEEDSVYINLNSAYYGEIEYEVEYKNEKATFPWLFVDYFMVADIAKKVGFDFELIQVGALHNYLCRLTVVVTT